MKLVNCETFLLNVPYNLTEVSSVVNRGGVSSIVVKLTTDTGIIGWGESCAGADIYSVDAALQAMWPFVKNRSPWDHEQIRSEVFHAGLWQLRASTGNYAWAGIDMALWDICGKSSNLPVYQLLGGKVRESVNYFYYLTHGSLEEIKEQCLDGVSKGFTVFYLKTGLDFKHEYEMVHKIREVIGPDKKIRIDSNGAWNSKDAPHFLEELDNFSIDFAEQPVREHPMSLMQNLRSKVKVPLAANEGLGSESDANRLIINEVADVYTFSPYWVGSLKKFQSVSYVADMMGAQVCRHTHGELGIAATAFHHVSMTIPNLVEGNQQTAAHMPGDILISKLPIVEAANWGIPDGVGLGIEIDENKFAKAQVAFQKDGPYLPYGKI
jgi:glucarate dehydratase